MAVDESEVRTLARLAHLALSDAEVREAAGDLERLLAYVRQLQAIDVEGAPETVHSSHAATPLREDVARPGFPRDVMMRDAPAAAAGLFEVPRVVVRTPKDPGAASVDDDGGEVAP